MYKGIDDTLYVEHARMEKGKKEENNAIDIRFIDTNDKKRGKRNFWSYSSKGTEEFKILLDRMLRFLAEMPVDRYHDYRIFRHTGLREYLIHRFLREQLNK
jgi:hypothetical protein